MSQAVGAAHGSRGSARRRAQQAQARSDGGAGVRAGAFGAAFAPNAGALIAFSTVRVRF